MFLSDMRDLDAGGWVVSAAPFRMILSPASIVAGKHGAAEQQNWRRDWRIVYRENLGFVREALLAFRTSSSREGGFIFIGGKLERAKGFEPSTPTLARLCSTPELHPLIIPSVRGS